MFDPLDERYRWCIHCSADCWPEPEYQKHDEYCPFVTGLWPVMEEDLKLGMCCGQCMKAFQSGDVYMHINMETALPQSRPAEMNEIVCVGCATAISILGAKYE